MDHEQLADVAATCLGGTIVAGLPMLKALEGNSVERHDSAIPRSYHQNLYWQRWLTALACNQSLLASFEPSARAVWACVQSIPEALLYFL